MCPQDLATHRCEKASGFFCNEAQSFLSLVRFHNINEHRSGSQFSFDSLITYLFDCSKPTKMFNISICLRTEA